MSREIEMRPTGTAHIFLDGRGVARIDGMRTKVAFVVIDHLARGLSPAEIHLHYPYLSLAQIHAALAYYYDHQAEIDRQIQESEEVVARLEARARQEQPSSRDLEVRLEQAKQQSTQRSQHDQDRSRTQ